MNGGLKIRWGRVVAALVLAIAIAGLVLWYLPRTEPREFALDRLGQQQLVELASKSPSDELAWSILGRRFLVGGYPAEAQRAFRSALGAQPGSLRAAAGYACAVALEGNWGRGDAMLRELESSNPDSADLCFFRGLLQSASDDGEHANASFLRATKLRSFDAELWYRLARSYLELGQKPAALAAARRAYELNDSRVEFQVFDGDLEMLVGDVNRGWKMLDQAVKRWPREALPRMTFALAILRKKRVAPDERSHAEKLLREAVALAPSWSQPRIELARVFLQDGDAEAARQQLEQIPAPELVSTEGGYLLSQVYVQLGRKEEGKQLAERYRSFTKKRLECTHLSYQADQSNQDPMLHLRAARCLAQMGSTLAASRHLQAALQTAGTRNDIRREAEAALRQMTR